MCLAQHVTIYITFMCTPCQLLGNTYHMPQSGEREGPKREQMYVMANSCRVKGAVLQ